MITTRTAGTMHAQTTSTGWLVPVLTMSTFLAMLHTAALGPLLPAIASDLDTSIALLGQIPAATMLLAAGLGMITGPLADRFEHNRTLILGLITIALSAIGMSLAPGFLLLLAASMIGAIGRAMVQPVATAIAGERFTGAKQRQAISWVSAGIMGSFMAGIPILTTITGMLGWRAALASLAGITLALVPLLMRNTGTPVGGHAQPSGASILTAWLPILRHPPTLRLITACLFGHAAIFMMVTYLGTFSVEHHHASTELVGWTYAAFGGALLAGSLVAGGRISGGPLRPLLVILRMTTGMAIAAMFVVPISQSTTVALLGTAGVAIGMTHVVMVLLLMQESPAGRATTLTLNTVTLSLGIALGNMLGGLLLSIGDFTLVGLCALLLSLASGGLVWSTRDRTIWSNNMHGA